MSANADEPPEVKTKPEEEGAQTNQLNPPNLNKQGKPEKRAVTSAKQAYGIAKSLFDRANTGRIQTAATVAHWYGGPPPFKTADLNRTGQGHRNNFSTNYLASVIDRVAPQITEPLTAADILVQKALPLTAEDGARKSRAFNEVFTKKVRGWAEWDDFLGGLAKEVCLNGNAIVTRLDLDWRPRMWGYDECFLPEGTGQHADKVQVAVFRQKFLVHEFMELFDDKATAERAGYNYSGCIKTTNEAMTGKQTEETALEQQEAIRELSAMGYSYATENQTKTVNVYHELVRDYSGEIDLWTVSQADGTEVRQSKGHHAQMRDCMTLFTFQSGNRRFYGSKGLGRLITNIHIALERHRNYTADKITFGGFPVIKSDDPVAVQFQFRYPFMVAPTGTDVLVEEWQVNWEASEGLDAKLVAIGEGIAGAFIPPNLDQGGSSKTKIEAAQKAEREVAVRQGVLARFANQSREMLDMMCRAMFSADALREGKRAFDDKKAKQEKGVMVLLRAAWKLLKKAFGAKAKAEPVIDTPLADEESVDAVVQLLEAGLTVEEIALLAVTPSSANNKDEGAEQDARTLQWIAAHNGDPYVDQAKAREVEANLAIGPARAQQLLIKQDDPNVKDAAMRMQLIEFGDLMDGVALPAVAADNHAIHRQVLAENLEPIIGVIQESPTPELINGAKMVMRHYDEHIIKDPLMTPDVAKEESAVLRGWWDAVAQVEKQLAEIGKKAAAAGMVGPGGAPPMNGAAQPPQPPPPEANGADPSGELATAADISLRTKSAAQKDRELTLQERKQSHAEEVDAAKLQQENIKIMQKAAEAERQAELQREAAGAAQKPIE